MFSKSTSKQVTEAEEEDMIKSGLYEANPLIAAGATVTHTITTGLTEVKEGSLMQVCVDPGQTHYHTGASIYFTKIITEAIGFSTNPLTTPYWRSRPQQSDLGYGFDVLNNIQCVSAQAVAGNIVLQIKNSYVLPQTAFIHISWIAYGT